MSKKLKKRLIRIIISLILFIPLFVIDKVIDLGSVTTNPNVGWLLPFLLYLLIYVLISYDILIKAAKNIRHGQIFDENFLMIVATFGAFAIQEFPEAVAVMLFYQIGEFFQDLAVGKSRKEIASLMDIQSDYANIINKDGTISQIEPELVSINDVIRVLPGEKVPLDGIIVNGASSLDTKALTGESLPVDVTVGSTILSGSVNLDSSIDIKVNKEYSDSTVNKILELVENSTNVKSKQENFITKFAKWYTPIVVVSALLLALIGSLITKDYYNWISRALNFLVVSCPCAIVISVPLSFFISIGRAAKIGILVKGSLYLENFNKVKHFIFDKTGTLTKGNFVVSKIEPISRKDEILRVAAICESLSIHPVALSIQKITSLKADSSYEINNVGGKGIVAKNKDELLICGNAKLMDDYGIRFHHSNEVGTILYVAKDHEFLGTIIINDEIKDNAKDLIAYLKSEHIKTTMLTGDNIAVANLVANDLGIDEVQASLLPQDKLLVVDSLIKNNKSKSLIAYVGDGINDAPTLARSDIGISMGGVGSDAAIEASDIVLMNDNLDTIIKAKKIAKKTIRIVDENIIFAILVKITILVLSALGIASIWLAVFGDVGVALLCVLNAFRSGRIKN